MQQTVKERLIEYLKYKNIGQNKFESLAGISNGYISNLKNAPGNAILTKILQCAPDLNRIWLLTGEGEMLNSSEPKPIISTTNGVPYYNVDFALGFDLVQNDQTTNCDYLIDFPPYNKCTCWVNAHGDSMAPTISSGDIVALQKIEDFRYLISGEIYAVVTSNGLRTIKRVDDLGDRICLVPDNKNYREQTIPKEEIIAVFSVKGCVKTY